MFACFIGSGLPYVRTILLHVLSAEACSYTPFCTFCRKAATVRKYTNTFFFACFMGVTLLFCTFCQKAATVRNYANTPLLHVLSVPRTLLFCTFYRHHLLFLHILSEAAYCMYVTTQTLFFCTFCRHLHQHSFFARFIGSCLPYVTTPTLLFCMFYRHHPRFLHVLPARPLFFACFIGKGFFVCVIGRSLHVLVQSFCMFYWRWSTVRTYNRFACFICRDVFVPSFLHILMVAVYKDTIFLHVLSALPSFFARFIGSRLLYVTTRTLLFCTFYRHPFPFSHVFSEGAYCM